MWIRLAASAVLFLACGAVRGAAFYVSPQGDDRNAATSAAKPARTIQAAVARMAPGDTCHIMAGVYRETIRFPRSGQAGRPITLLPWKGASVTITGCDPITGWTRDTGPAWKAPMRWTLGPGRNQVFARGEVLLEARHPNTPAPGLEMPVRGLSPLWPTFGAFSIPKDTGVAQPGRIVSRLLDGVPENHWKGALYYGVHYEGWCGQTGVVESSKAGEIQVTDRTQGWWFPSAYGVNDNEDGRGMLVGHRNALDQPGEWYWQDDSLVLIPRGDGPPTGVEAKRRQIALDLSDREHIVIRGLRVHGASVRLDGSAWCTFDGCDLRYISHFLLQYNMGQIEKGRDTIRSGETGIYVSGHDNAFLNCSVRWSAGAGFHLRGYHHTIHNCLVDEVSYTGHYLNAVTDAVGDYGDYENLLVGGHVVAFNTMRNAGRHFFNFYGNGTSTASRTRSGMDYMATLFAHNHLYNGMLQTRDAGFITGLYCSAGTLNGLNSQVVYNVLHDCYDLSAIRWGILGPIYLDAGTANVDVRNNLLWAAPGALQKGVWFNTCCAQCSDVDNVFHRYFRRTSAQLVPADFPKGRPFRFGHDFAAPPKAPAWPPVAAHAIRLGACRPGSEGVRITPQTIENLSDGDCFIAPAPPAGGAWRSATMGFATGLSSMNTDRAGRTPPRHMNATDPLVLEVDKRDGASPGIGSQWTFINNVRADAWVRFDRVPLGRGYLRFRAVYGKVTDAPASVEVRLDAPDGPLAAQCRLRRTDRPRTGSIQIYREDTCAVSAQATGTRDIYLRFLSGDAARPVGEFEYFRFEGYRGEIALAPNEVKIEVRAGNRAGPKLGEFYPRFTGGPNTFRTLVAPLEAVPPGQPLCFVVRSSQAGPIGRIASIGLMRALGAGPGPSVGIAPRRDSRGRMVLPAATHRPRYQPPPAPKGAQIPAQGLVVWLDAASTPTVVREAGGRVSAWRDRSGRGNDAAQPDAEFRPTYEARALNGKPALRFTEKASTRLHLGDLSSSRINATAFAVVSNPEPGDPLNHGARVFTASDGTEFDYQGGIALSVPGMATGGPRVIHASFENRAARFVRVGCFLPIFQTYFTGLIAEILVYDRILAADEIETVRAYLTKKWKLVE